MPKTDLAREGFFNDNATAAMQAHCDPPETSPLSRSIATRVVDRITYLLVRVLICVVQSLPRSTCESMARNWSDFLANRVKIRRHVVRDKQIGNAIALLQIHQQIHNLRLNRNVKR